MMNLNLLPTDPDQLGQQLATYNVAFVFNLTNPFAMLPSAADLHPTLCQKMLKLLQQLQLYQQVLLLELLNQLLRIQHLRWKMLKLLQQFQLFQQVLLLELLNRLSQFFSLLLEQQMLHLCHHLSPLLGLQMPLLRLLLLLPLPHQCTKKSKSVCGVIATWQTTSGQQSCRSSLVPAAVIAFRCGEKAVLDTARQCKTETCKPDTSHCQQPCPTCKQNCP